MGVIDDFQIITGLGPLGTEDPANFATRFTSVMSNIIGVLTVSGGLWFVFQIFMASFNWLTSGGEKQQLENAKKRFTNSIIGLFLVVASYGIIVLVTTFLGLPIINLENLILSLDPR